MARSRIFVEGYEVSPPVLVPLLLTAAGLLSVDQFAGLTAAADSGPCLVDCGHGR